MNERSSERRAVRFVSRRFHARRAMPRSIRMMRLVAGIGVTVAVAALMVAVSVGRGFERAYTKALLDFNAHVILMGAGEIDDPAPALKTVMQMQEEVPGRIRVATPFLYREALLLAGGTIKGIVIKGVDPSVLSQGQALRVSPLDASQNALLAFGRRADGTPSLILGKALAADVDLASSRKARIMIPQPDGAKGPQHQFVDATITGTFASGMHDYDSQFALMDIDSVRRLFQAGKTTVTGIEITLTDPMEAHAIAAQLERDLGPRYRAVTWDELNVDLLAAVKLERLVSAIIMGLMLIVAALNIVAVLVLTTIRRLPQISLLKALGFRDRAIAQIFLRGGMRVGWSGIVVGLLLGIGLSWVIDVFRLIPLESEVYLIDALPIDISWTMCGMIFFFCTIVIFLTSRFAARRLALVPPCEGLAQAR